MDNTNNFMNFKEKTKRKRSANWDQIEKNLLKRCIMEFVNIIENKNTDTNSNKSKTAAWQKVLQRFNELNNRVRDLPEIKQQWRTMKLDAKKKISDVKTLMKRTGGGPKPPSPDPETLEIVSMIPQEFETDRNVFDSDGIGTSPKKQEMELDDSVTTQEFVLTSVANIETTAKKQDLQLDDSINTQELVLTPTVSNTEVTAENMMTPKTSEINFLHQKKSVMKRKLPFNDDNKPKQLDKEFAKERNHVLLSCIRQEHELKMKNLMEIHRFATEEHNLRMQIEKRNQNLLNEESQLRMQKLKLEIALLKTTNNL